MKENLHNDNDNLENFFRDRLQGYNDIPGGDMWDRIESKIPPKPESKSIIRPLFIWTSSAVAACLILFLGFNNYQYQKKLDAISSQLEESKGSISSLNEEISSFKNYMETQYSSNQNNTTNSNKIIPTRNNGNIEVNQLGNNGKKPPVITVGNQNKSSSSSTKNYFPILPTKENNNTTVVYQDNSSNTTTIQNDVKEDIIEDNNTSNQKGLLTKTNLNALPSISFPSLEVDLKEEIPSIKLAERKKKIKELDGGKWYVAASYAPQMLVHKYSNPNPAITQKVNYDESIELPYDIGVRLGYSINKNLSIYTGLRYDESRVNIRHAGNMAFSSELEVPLADENLYSPSQYNMETSVGNIDVKMYTVREPNIIVEEGRNIPMLAELSYNKRELEIPVIAQYNIGRGDLFFSVKGGIVGNISLKEDIKVNHLRTYDEDVYFHNISYISKEPLKDKLSLSYLMGVGLNYRVSDELTAFVEPTLEGLTKKTTFNSGGQTYPFSVGLEAGLAYRF